MKFHGMAAFAPAAAIAAFVIAGCASAPRLGAGDKIAIVGFYLEKAIVKSGSTTPPKSLVLGDRKAYFKYHQESVDRLWTAFKDRAPSIFGQDRLVAVDRVEGNADVLAASAPSVRRVLGIETRSDDDYLHPEGLNYVSLSDEKQNARLAALTGATLTAAIDVKAEYLVGTGLAVGSIGGARARMRLTAVVKVADSAGRVVGTARIVGESKESVVLVGVNGDYSLPPEEYPRLIASAGEELFAKLATEVGSW